MACGLFVCLLWHKYYKEGVTGDWWGRLVARS